MTDIDEQRPADNLLGQAHPINWDLLGPDDAEEEWLALNEWVHWLRRTFALSAAVIPPLWHRHPELVWELSALHIHFLGAYDRERDSTAALGWLADFSDSQDRLREWVALAGSRLNTDRATRQTAWPGEVAAPEVQDTPIINREDDFHAFVRADIERREQLLDGLRLLRGDTTSSEMRQGPSSSDRSTS